MTPRAKKTLAVLVGLAILAVVTGYVVIKVFFDDAPPRLDSRDLDRALSTTSPSAAVSSAAPVSSTAPPTTIPAASSTTTGASAVAGRWTLVGDASTVGYRVKEVLGGVDVEGAGRTNRVTGSLTIAATAATTGEFTVDVASISSDDDRRDRQFRGRIMDVAKFPTASFRLTEPIEFGSPAEGTAVKVDATGELTLHGVTRSVTFPIEAKLAGGRIGVLGNIPVVFADYQIPNPSNAFAKTEDRGLLEFVLVFAKG